MHRNESEVELLQRGRGRGGGRGRGRGGGGHPLVQVNSSTFLDRRRPKTSGVVAKEQQGGASKQKRPTQSCVSGAKKVRNLKILGYRFTARCRGFPARLLVHQNKPSPCRASAGSQQAYKQAVLDLIYVSSGETGPEYHSCDLAFFFLDLTKGQKYFSPRISL